MAIFVVDIGGSNLQTGVYEEETLKDVQSIPTPKTYKSFENHLAERLMSVENDLEGIAISSPGLVNETTQEIKEPSAVPFIHTHNLWALLEKRFNLPVSIINDANASAVCEMALGAGREVNNAIFMVLGTGIGGAVIVNRQLVLGHHLSTGEFGMMGAYTGLNLSRRGSVYNTARLYTEKTGEKIDGEVLFERFEAGDSVAVECVDGMYDALSKALFDLQMIFDSEMVIISGGISQRSTFVDTLTNNFKQLLEQVDLGHLMPIVTAAKYKNQSNLIGAAIHFKQRQEETTC